MPNSCVLCAANYIYNYEMLGVVRMLYDVNNNDNDDVSKYCVIGFDVYG